MEATSGRFKLDLVPPPCSAMSCCSCVRDSMHVLTLLPDRIVMASSRLLGATAACVILLSFAAGHRKSYWKWLHQGCDDDLSAIFFNFGGAAFPCKFPLKKFFESVFFIFLFWLWRRDLVLELQFLSFLRVVLLCSAIQSAQIAL